MALTVEPTPLALGIAAVLCAGQAAAAPGDPVNATEFPANDTSPNFQQNADLAAAADGRFVVVWSGEGPGDANGIFFRRFAADGTPLDAADQSVHAPTAGAEERPAVAMAPNGDFVVVWDQAVGGEVVAQRFNADGSTLGAQIPVFSDVDALNADVAIDPDGDFVVVWENYGPNGDVRADTFIAGVGQGNFVVNDITDSGAVEPAVAAVQIDATPANNDFVVAWTEPQAGAGTNIFFERNPDVASATGQAANDGAVDGNLRGNPDVTMDAAGNFVVAWDGFHASDPSGVSMKRYQADTTPLDPADVLVNTVTAGFQGEPSVAMHDNGDLTVAYTVFGVDDTNIAFQRFAASDLSAQGPETIANTITIADQFLPAVGADGAGDTFAIAWSDSFNDGNTPGVFARVFEGPSSTAPPPPPPQPGPTELILEAKAKGLTLGPLALAAALLGLLPALRRRRR